MNMSSRLREQFNDVVKPELMKEFNYKSVMQVPRLEKIVVNMGVGEAIGNSRFLDEALWVKNFNWQQPVITKAKNQYLTLN